MQTLLLFSLSFSAITTIGMVIFSYRIMKMHVTPSLTWSLKLGAVSIQCVQIALSVFYINDIANFLTTFLTTFPPEQVVVSYALGAIRNGLLFGFVSRVYYTLRSKFAGIDVPEI